MTFRPWAVVAMTSALFVFLGLNLWLTLDNRDAITRIDKNVTKDAPCTDFSIAITGDGVELRIAEGPCPTAGVGVDRADQVGGRSAGRDRGDRSGDRGAGDGGAGDRGRDRGDDGKDGADGIDGVNGDGADERPRKGILGDVADAVDDAFGGACRTTDQLPTAGVTGQSGLGLC